MSKNRNRELLHLVCVDASASTTKHFNIKHLTKIADLLEVDMCVF
jgi:hypothetical protein